MYLSQWILCPTPVPLLKMKHGIIELVILYKLDMSSIATTEDVKREDIKLIYI